MLALKSVMWGQMSVPAWSKRETPLFLGCTTLETVSPQKGRREAMWELCETKMKMSSTSATSLTLASCTSLFASKHMAHLSLKFGQVRRPEAPLEHDGILLINIIIKIIVLGYVLEFNCRMVLTIRFFLSTLIFCE